MPWQVRLLGDLRVALDDLDVTSFGTTKATALFGFLAARTPAYSSREDLAETLWPDCDLAHARNSLSSALSMIRRKLGHGAGQDRDLLEGDNRVVRIRPHLVVTDAATFEAAAEQARRAELPAERAGLLAACVQLYGGEFLPGLDWPWVLAERARLAALLVETVRGAVTALTQTGQAPRALEVCRLAVARAPLSHELPWLTIEVLQHLGRDADAHRIARQQVDLLRGLGHEPDARLLTLLQPSGAVLAPAEPDPRAEGLRLLADADPAAALVHFATASGAARDHHPSPAEALRLGLTFAACPQLLAWQDAGEPLSCCALAPTGRLAVGSATGKVLLWDPAAQRVEPCPGGRAALTHLALAEAERRLVTVDATGLVRVVDLVRRRPVGGPGIRLEWPVTCLASSSDQRYAAAGDAAGQVLVRRLADGAAQVWPAHHHTTAVAFAHDGETLISAGSEGRVRCWATSSGEPLGPGWVQSGPITCLAVSPDGRWLVAADGHGQAVVRALAGDPHAPLTLRHPTKAIIAVAFSPDSQELVTAGADGTLRRWRPADGPAVAQQRLLGGECRALLYRPDGLELLWLARNRPAAILSSRSLEPQVARLEPAGDLLGAAWRAAGQQLVVVTAAGLVKLYEVRGLVPAHRRLHTRDRHVGQAVLTADQQLISAGADGAVRLGPATEPRATRTLRHPAAVWHVALAPGGRILATACRDGAVRLWSTAQAALQAELWQGGVVRRVAFSADGTLLAAAAHDRTVRLWTVPDGRPYGPALAHQDAVRAAHFLRRDGGELLTLDRGGCLRRWRLPAGEPRWEATHPGLAWDLAISPDEEFAVVVGSGGVTVVATATGARRAGPWPLAGVGQAVAVSPDSRRIMVMTQEGLTRTFDALTGQAALPDLLHDEWVHGGCFSPEGDWQATWSDDRTVRLWDSLTGHRLGPPLRHLGLVNHATWCPTTRQLAAACSDGTVYLWRLAVPDLPRWRWQQLAETVTGLAIERPGVTATPHHQSPAAGWAAAEPVLAQLAEQRGNHLTWHGLQADRCRFEECWAGAAWHLDLLAAAEPDNTWVALRRGWVAAAQGHWSAAATAYRVAAADLELALLALAEQLLVAVQQGEAQTAAAASALVAALADTPLQPQRWPGLRALAVQRDGRRHLAALGPDRLAPLACDTEVETQVTWAAVLHRVGRPAAARAVIEQAWALPRNPRSAFGHLVLALGHAAEGDHATAADLVAQARARWDGQAPAADWTLRLTVEALLAEAAALGL